MKTLLEHYSKYLTDKTSNRYGVERMESCLHDEVFPMYYLTSNNNPDISGNSK